MTNEEIGDRVIEWMRLNPENPYLTPLEIAKRFGSELYGKPRLTGLVMTNLAGRRLVERAPSVKRFYRLRAIDPNAPPPMPSRVRPFVPMTGYGAALTKNIELCLLTRK